MPDNDYAGVLAQHLPADDPALSPGPFLNTAGAEIGEHGGFARFTIGQRRGLPGGYAEPMYVVAIDPERRAVVIGTGDDLYAHRAVIREVNWLAAPLAPGDTCELQVRYRARPVPARAVSLDGDHVQLDLTEPARAVAPGQSGVLYDGERVLGGGVLD